MIAAYVRVSSKAQDTAMQRSSIERLAAVRGDSVASWYSERRSGKSIVRPELERLRVDVRAGLVERLYVFRIDRLTRSGIRDTFELIEELKGHGVELVTVSDGFDLNGPAAEVVLAVMAWASKMERLAINERISAARERMDAEGKRWGHPFRMDTYTYNQALRMRQEGRSLRKISMALKVPLSTVARACRAGKVSQAGVSSAAEVLGVARAESKPSR